MTTAQFLSSAWNWNPWVIILCAAAIAAHCLRRPFPGWRPSAWLLAGTLLFFLTLASPLDALANGYLFSAHMAQHLSLLLLVPPLILLSLPAVPVPRRWQRGPGKCLYWVLDHPWATWLLGVGGMWIWHLPALCNAAVANPWIHRLQYASLLGMGFAFWWPILGPGRKLRLPPPGGMLYLFSACLGCTVLGILITFAPVELCSVYLHPLDRLGIVPLLQNQWGLTPAKDQQLGGLLMWVPACLIYTCGILGLFLRWHGETGGEAVASEPQLANTFGGGAHGH